MTSQGLVIARHRREVIIESAAGKPIRGLVRGRQLKPVPGDEVNWHTEADGTAVVSGVLPRRTLLERIDSRGRTESIAANLTLVAVVVAAEPAADWGLVDRYLVAAALHGIGAMVIRNKSDIANPEIDRRLATYAGIGYRTATTSVSSGSGLTAASEALSGERAVLVGQSGVGKSSLINALLGSDEQAVGELSQRRSLGKHTTTASVLHRLPGGGEIIDSPGVRRYAPYVDDPDRLAHGFVEFRPYLGHCRFNDCRHIREPECAIRAAVEKHEIDAERYRSYVALRKTLTGLKSARDGQSHRA